MGIFYSTNEKSHIGDKKILNEVYFGETDDIKEIQYYLSQWRQNALRDSSQLVKRYNTDPWREKFEEKVADTFGFKNFEMIIVPMNEVNAYTFIVGGNYDITSMKLKKAFEPTNKGFKFNKDYGFNCITRMYEGLFLQEKISDREVLAIILHELGHNFQEVLNNRSSIFSPINKVLRLVQYLLDIMSSQDFNPINIPISVLMNTNAYSNIDIAIDKIIYKNKNIGAFNDTINFILGIGYKTMYIVF